MKHWKLILTLMLGYLFGSIVVGGALNKLAIYNNDGRMPVRSDWVWQTSTHFAYDNKSQVNLWFLSDFIPIGHARLSIGDAIMLSGVFLNVMACVFILIYFRGQNAKERQRKA